MKLITTIFIAIILFSCKPDKPVVKPPAPKDTVIVIPKPIDTVIIINDPVDTIKPPPPLPVIPVVVLKPFEINADIENETIQDLKDVLKEYKDGREINIIKVPLERRTGQAFYISANKSSVQLKYTTKQSLENAVYTYLDMLGIHWYGAGVNWLVKPTILNTVNIAGEWKEPTFRNRIFAGTGGLETALTIDPNYNYRNNWYAWKRRIRMNADFYDVGHSGSEFYNDNSAILDANPDWFISGQGRRSGRIKIDNPAAVEVYKTWAQKQYNPKNDFTTIGTDPEDGRGGSDDPLPPDGFEGKPVWNNADKTWWLTNEVAKMFDENNNKVQITAYAYGDGPYNALVPKFKLRKNVYPIIIPYAFQTAYLPNEMIRTWAKTIDGKMGIYDYWNITQWSLGLPQFNIYSIPEKLKFWNANKVNGMNIETTDAGGAMGHAWWLAGQLEWDLNKNIDTLFKKYLVDCFGAGWQPMKNMYSRWSLSYQGAAEVNFSLKDLKDATDAVVINSAEWKRINDLKAYVHFMKLMAQRTNTQPNNDSIYQYIYSIHQRMLVQTAAFTGQSYLGVAPAPTTAHQLTNAEVESNFIADLAELPTQYNVSDFVFDYDKVSYTVPVDPNAWRFGTSANFAFKAQFTGAVSITAGAESMALLKIADDNGVIIKDTVGVNNYTLIESLQDQRFWHIKDYSFNVVEGQFYTITTRGGFNMFRVNTPRVILFTGAGQEDFDNYAYPKKYFYVPKGTTEIVFSNPYVEAAWGSAVSPSGITLHRTSVGAKDTYKVTVPKGDDGKVWYLALGSPYWQLRNLPNYFSLQTFKYTE